MSNMDLVRAWKDEEYRLSLSDAELTQIAPNPVGLNELTDIQMSAIGGGKKTRGSTIVNNTIPIVGFGDPHNPGGIALPITITNIAGGGT